MPATQTNPVLQLTGISKRFNGIHALNGVNITIRAGECMALIGENGAGKSTLVKTLTGIYRPDAGTLSLDGRPVTFASPQEAMAAGITAVHQETVMFDELSVAENIYVGRQPVRGGRIDWARIEREAEALFARLEVALPVKARVKDLSVAQRHFVEIARALAQDARVVIMDEPTAALSQREIRELYRIIDQLKAAGTAVIFISHKFDEIFAVADSYTVLRDGQFVAEGRLADITEQELVALMVGRAVHQAYPKLDAEIGEPLLVVQNLSHPTEFDDVSFTLRRGEILGFYGLVGAGRSELLRTIFALDAVRAGTVSVGTYAGPASPLLRWQQGLGLLSEDRKTEGLALNLSLEHNLTLPKLDRRIRPTALAAETADWIGRLGVRCAGPHQAIGGLSGGNQQKIALGRLLRNGAEVLLLDEPTRGVDIGAKQNIYRLIDELACSGKAVLMVSSYLPELLGTCDRIAVMCRGVLSPARPVADWTEHSIMLAATGTAAA